MKTERHHYDPNQGDAVFDGYAFRHEALLYQGLSDFVDGAASFIEDGLGAGDPILVVVSAEKIELLRRELGPDADRVDFADMADAGANPARIIPVWYDFVAQHGKDRHIRGIGEPISNERSPEALVECQRHESLLNLAFEEADAWWLLCPYDVALLPSDVIEEALRSHPTFVTNGNHQRSDAYAQLAEFRRPFDRPLHEPASTLADVGFATDKLDHVRRVTCTLAMEAGLSSSRIDDLVVAVNEVVINSLRHGGGAGRLRVWRENGSLVCEVSDAGSLDIPLVGRKRPVAGQEGGFGIWLVHQLCDLVQLRTFDDGTVVRMHMNVSAN